MTTFLYCNKSIIAAVFLVLLAFLLSLSCSVYASTQEASTTSPICGNNIQETGEQCDGSDLGGASCVSQGFSSGTLLCASSCVFDTSSCTSGGGGGGGGGGSVPLPVTSVIFSGRAYPQSAITLLKDAQIATTTIAGANANFQISISGLSGGNYIFSVYGEDKASRRSSLLTFQVSVTQGATTRVTGIFIAPTIAVDKSAVKRGDNIAIFGQSAPESEITIAVNSAEEFFVKAQADDGGIYLYNFDTAVLEMGEHFTKSKTALNGEISSFSKAVSFTVGAESIIKEEQKEQVEKQLSEGDSNNDGKVNLIDFSIMAYWYNRPSPPDNIDLNNDHKIDLVDFSIMAYYWTG
ncbi:MAG: dockerin type I repeat-containing protein [Candidatus Pacebacteria bacterium]|nr:dockerin type I repeat-containing protein [Candidatus Paceibacterota bacterium]